MTEFGFPLCAAWHAGNTGDCSLDCACTSRVNMKYEYASIINWSPYCQRLRKEIQLGISIVSVLLCK